MSSDTEFIDRAIARLRAAGVASPEADVWSMVAALRGGSRGEAQAQALIGADLLDADQLERFDQWVARREQREPLWQITGVAPFAHLELEVGPGVFTPRPETELLAQQAVSEALQVVPAGDWVEVVDLCAGSGAIGLAIASQVHHSRLLGVESSETAAEYLQRNIDRVAPERARLVIGDLAEAREHLSPHSVDLVVSNPPYLVEGEDVLDDETARFDPPEALFADDEGMAVVYRVITEAAWLLRPGGVVLIEHGTEHGEPTRQALREAGFWQVETHQDLLGRDRFSRGVAESR